MVFYILLAFIFLFLNIFIGSQQKITFDHNILLFIRIPRAIIAFLAGSALAMGGVIAQGLFRNVLACPSILGVQVASILAITIGYSLSLDLLYYNIIPYFAALGAFLNLCILLLWLRTNKNITSLVLVGTALTAIFAAFINVMVALQIDKYELSLKISNWMLGSFENGTWKNIQVSIIPLVIGFFICFILSHKLDVLYLGEETAASLGVNLLQVRILGVIAISLLAGTISFLVGAVSFVGLIVPHICRKIVGGKHHLLLVYSFFIGGILTSCVDLLSKLFPKFYIAPGIILGLIGAPFFLWVLNKEKQYEI